MAAIYKRKNSKYWWAYIQVPTGGRISESTRTTDRKNAQEYADKRQFEIWAEVKLGKKPKYTWNDAVIRWAEEKSDKKSYRDDVLKFRWLHHYFNDVPLEDISRDRISEVGRIKMQQASKSTANRFLALIRAVLRAAEREWEWIEKAPHVRLYKEPAGREKWFTMEQAKLLLAQLPPHQADLALFALSVGWRQSNVLQLEWSQVDFDKKTARLKATDTKNGKPLAIPLNEVALAILRKQAGKHPTRVFTYRGEPIKQVNTKAWRRALKTAGLDGFRWHDLRHTWASWMVQSGVSLTVLQELGGWETASMVRRYAHHSADQLAYAAARIESQLVGMDNLSNLKCSAA